MKVIFVRHGQSLNNKLGREGVPYGSQLYKADPHLTQKGEKEARALGKYLASNIEVSEFISSPFLRTLQTTQLIREGFSQKPKVRVERDYHEEKGIFDQQEYNIIPGMGRTQITNLYPDYQVEDAITQEGWFLGHTEIEDHEECRERVKRLVATLSHKAQDGKFEQDKYIVCVSHGMFISRLFSYLHGLYASPRYSKRILRVINSSISMASFPKSHKGLVLLPFFNITPHLE